MATIPANNKVMDAAIDELKKILQEQEQTLEKEFDEIVEQSEKEKAISDYDRAMKGI